MRKPRVGPTVVGAIIVAGVLAAGATRAWSPRPRPASGVVIVSLDTTRADRLPAYGFASVSTPTLDRLAREGVVFEDAESVAPLTLTAHTSLFTGLSPQHHGVRDNADAPLDRSTPVLAEVLRQRGFQTAAFVGSFVLARDRGLARGFDLYRDVEGTDAHGERRRRRPANEVVDEAVAWIDGLKSPRFCLWIHLYDAHAPQALPLAFRRAYGDRYEGALAYMDSQLARVIDALARGRLLKTTTIVVVGDHGESLGEHGEQEHGIFLYEGALHVPFILRTPGVAPRRLEGLVSLIDVMPTVLDLLGVEGPQSIDGDSLVPVLRGAPEHDRVIYAESMYAKRFGWSPLRMVRAGSLKYIEAPRPELYDLASDPFEERNLFAQRPAAIAALRAELRKLGSERTFARRDSPALRPEQFQMLSSLGYVSGGPSADAPTPNTGLDPKDYIAVYNAIRARSRR